MTAAKSFNDVKRCLARRLESCEFTGAGGGLFWRGVQDTVVVLEFQKDRYSTKDEVRFTINVGISVNALRAAVAASGGPSTTDVPSPDKCHWHARLGRLLSSPVDLWWMVRDEETAQSVCNEIANALIGVALPKTYEVASSGALVRMWQGGGGYGLTEYERRLNLARLLCELNRMEEADAAIQALENASLGKPWEASASYDVKVLRKRLG